MIVHFPIVLFIITFVIDVVIVARSGSLAGRTTLSNTALWLM
jgi:uncharacterized membrane protein